MGLWDNVKKNVLFPTFYCLNERVLFPTPLYVIFIMIEIINVTTLIISLTPNDILEPMFGELPISNLAIYYIPLDYSYSTAIIILAAMVGFMGVLLSIFCSLRHKIDKNALIKKVILPLFCYFYVFIDKLAIPVIYKLLFDAFLLSDTANSVAAIIMLIAITFLLLLLKILFIDDTIHSKLPWNGKSTIQSTIRYAIKVYAIYVIYSVPDGRTPHGIIIALLCVVSCFHSIIFRTYTNSAVRRLETAVDFGMAWMALCVSLNLVIGAVDMYNILIIVFMPIAGASGILAQMLYEESKCAMLVKLEKLTSNEYEIAMLRIAQEMNSLLKCDKYNRDFLNSLVIYHCIKCKMPACPGMKLVERFEEKEEIAYPMYAKFIVMSTLMRKKEHHKYKHSMYIWVSEILYSFLQLKLSSLMYLMLASKDVKEYSNEFKIYTLRKRIMAKVHNELSKTEEGRNNTVSQLLFFHQRFIEFQEALKKCTSQISSFWKDILRREPEISKIVDKSFEISNSINESADIFEFLKQKNPSFAKCYILFALFYKEVLLDKENAKHMKRSAKSIISSYTHRELGNKQDNELELNANASILRVSIKSGRFGIILSCNNEVEPLLGYQSAVLIGRSINILIPDIVSEYHDIFMKALYTVSDSDLKEKRQLTFALHNDGYIVPIKLIVKALPNLDGEIEISGIITLAKSIGNIMTSDESLKAGEGTIFLLDSQMCICGLHKSIARFCKNSETTMQYHKFRCNIAFQILFPEVFTPQNMEKMAHPEGFDCTINLGSIIEMIFSDIKETSDYSHNSSQYTVTATQTMPANIRLQKFEYASPSLNIVWYCIQISFVQASSIGDFSDFQRELQSRKQDKIHISKSDIASQSSVDPNERMLNELKLVSSSNTTPLSVSRTIKIFSSINVAFFALVGTNVISCIFCYVV